MERSGVGLDDPAWLARRMVMAEHARPDTEVWSRYLCPLVSLQQFHVHCEQQVFVSSRESHTRRGGNQRTVTFDDSGKRTVAKAVVSWTRLNWEISVLP